jgi:hypothetical protein
MGIYRLSLYRYCTLKRYNHDKRYLEKKSISKGRQENIVLRLLSRH